MLKTDHLELDNDFWDSIFSQYFESQKPIVLPIKYDVNTVRYVLDKLDCSDCKGICCYHKRIHISQMDIDRIVESGLVDKAYLSSIINESNGKRYFDGSRGGCPFLENHLCSIWKYRPNICYLYPIQSPLIKTVNGKQISFMRMNVLCQQAFKIVREIYVKAVKDQNGILLPDLRIIKRT